jgi:hypothetical protein
MTRGIEERAEREYRAWGYQTWRRWQERQSLAPRLRRLAGEYVLVPPYGDAVEPAPR